IISKMGISTIVSYRGGQLFEIIGLDPEVVDLCFRGTQSRIKGATFEDLQEDQQLLAKAAWNDMVSVSQGGLLKFVHGGEYHMYSPEVVALLQAAVPTGDYGQYQAFAKAVNERPASTLRDLLQLKPVGPAISIDEVESEEAILARFDSAGMSLGALSPEAHE